MIGQMTGRATGASETVFSYLPFSARSGWEGV